MTHVDSERAVPVAEFLHRCRVCTFSKCLEEANGLELDILPEVSSTEIEMKETSQRSRHNRHIVLFMGKSITNRC